MNNYIKLALSIPKTLAANLKYFPLVQAIRFPLLVSYKTKLGGWGKIEYDGAVKTGMFRVGFHDVPVCNASDDTKLEINGTIICNGSFHVGNGSKIRVLSGAVLTIGNNFGISASSTINCYNRITIGDDVLLAWNCLVMDSDTHPIFDTNDNIINRSREVVIGNKVWMGCNSTVLKGSNIPSNCVIGANSLVSGAKFTPNTVISGNPAKSKAPIGYWKEHYKNFR